ALLSFQDTGNELPVVPAQTDLLRAGLPPPAFRMKVKGVTLYSILAFHGFLKCMFFVIKTAV
ncbi:MAG: hypothetical protein AAGU23_10850, partial [Bacillota bacterium]